MENIKVLVDKLSGTDDIYQQKEMVEKDASQYQVYPHSIRVSDDTLFFMAKTSKGKALVVKGKLADKFSGEAYGGAMICPLDVANSESLMSVFAFTRPVRHKGKDASLGLGDRLGLASAAHLRLLAGKGVFPVIAQQSIRELNFTKRSYRDVLASSVFAVFQEGYEDGFGMDGDHLKSPEEVNMALDSGCTMITIDSSEHIHNDAVNMSDEQIAKEYSGTDALIDTYCSKPFELSGGNTLAITKPELMKYYLMYEDVIDFIEKIYKDLIVTCERPIDFEVSLDETEEPISPGAHYFIASELIKRDVQITSLAPRFTGEFQKGIDYIGDIKAFEEDVTKHNQIAQTLGYKLSIHSGSDKFSILPIVGKVTKGKWHLKTSGTNWLEAVHVISVKNPALFRKMFAHAKGAFSDALKYYHVSASLDKIPDIDGMPNDQLATLLDLVDSRQLMHITYGRLLNDVDENGKYIIRDDFFDALHQYETVYDEFLIHHIGRHLTGLGIQ